MYNLLLKGSGEVVDRTSANSLEEATLFFIRRKQMDKKTFNKLYDVNHSTDVKG